MSDNTISVLVKKKDELTQKMNETKHIINQLKIDIETIDRAIKICSPNYEIVSIKKRKESVVLFEMGEFKRILFNQLKTSENYQSLDDIIDGIAESKKIIFCENFKKKDLKEKLIRNCTYYINRGVLNALRENGKITHLKITNPELFLTRLDG